MSERSKQTFLDTLDREHAITLKVLRAYPPDQLDLRPVESARTARQLAWTFVMERGLAVKVWRDELKDGIPAGAKPPEPPQDWGALLAALERAQAEYRALIAAASEEELEGTVTFFTAPRTMGAWTRWEWIWFLLHDEIHHRGQLSVYLKMAGGKVPSIYGPSADEPWT